MADEPSNTASRLSTPGTVGADDECFSTVAAALDAAVDGDTVRLPRGTFRGGVTITRSVTLAGAGMGETVLRGGGPVLTIGTLGQTTPPTVTIRDVAITAGRTTTSELSRFLTGEDAIWALGGGIEVPPGAFGDDFLPAPGATVTLSRTRLSGNRAAPSASVPSGLPCPGGEDCPFAIGAGGGVDTWGDLTVVDSTIEGNQAGGTSAGSDAGGGGIRSWVGRLTFRTAASRATSPPRLHPVAASPRAAASSTAAGSCRPAAGSPCGTVASTATSPASTPRCRTASTTSRSTTSPWVAASS